MEYKVYLIKLPGAAVYRKNLEDVQTDFYLGYQDKNGEWKEIEIEASLEYAQIEEAEMLRDKARKLAKKAIWKLLEQIRESA